MNDKIKQLYDVVGQEYDLGTYDEFKARLQQDGSRKKFYDVVGQEYDLGDYDSFSSIVTSYPDSTSSTPSAPAAEEIAEEMQPQDSGYAQRKAHYDEVGYVDAIKKSKREANKEKRKEFLKAMIHAGAAAEGDMHAAELVREHSDNWSEARERKNKLKDAALAASAGVDVDEYVQYYGGPSLAEVEQRAATREYMQESGMIDDMKDMRKEARKEKRKSLLQTLGTTAMLAEGIVADEVAEANQQQAEEYRQNKVIAQTLDEALDKARAGEIDGFGEGIAKGALGLWDSATRAATWDFGVSDAINGMTIYQILQKYEEDPESLSETERRVLDAMGMATAVQEAYQDQLGIGYAVGESLPVSMGFMASMALNPASGIGKAVAREAVRRYGRNSIKVNAARVLGDIAETAIMTATTGAGRVAADAMERINGRATYDIDPETGMVIYGGQKDQVEVGKAVMKAIGASFIENYTEAVGNYMDFDPLYGMMKGVAAKGLRKANLNKWADALTDVDPATMSSMMRNFKEKVKFDGVLGEIMEEEIGMAMNALFVGDNAWSDFLDVETQATTILSCAIMSVALNAAGGMQYGKARKAYEQNVNRTEREAARVFGDRFADLKDRIDLGSPEEAIDVFNEIYQSQDYTLEQKRKLMEYATARVSLQYFNTTEQKARRELLKDEQNMRDAYDAGRAAQLSTYYNIENEYEKAEAAINERENAEEIWDAVAAINRAPAGEVQNILNGFSEEDQRLINTYRYNAARVTGAINHRAEQIDDLVDEYAGQVNPYAVVDEQGNRTVTTAILGDEVVYVMNQENGDAVVYTNDGRKAMVKMSALENVQTHDADELIEKFRQQTTQVVNQETEKNLSYPSEVQEPAEGVTVETLDGKRWQVAATDGENVELVGMIFDKKSGQWLPNAGDYRKMTREQFVDWQKAELDRKKANTYDQGDELTFYVGGGEPISAEITGITPEGDYMVQISQLVDGLNKSISDVYTAEELRKLTTPSSKVSEKTAENESAPTGEIKQSVTEEVTNSQVAEMTSQPTEQGGNVIEPTAEVAESVNTALSRVPKDAKGNPLYEQTDADTAWDAIVEETGGDAEMAQRIAEEMATDKKAALVKMQNGKPKKGATVAEKIANEKAHIAAIAQAEQEVAAWEKIAQVNAIRQQSAELERAEAEKAEAEQRKAEEARILAEQEEQARIEREQLNGVPDMVDDVPADARARGYRRVNGHKVDRQGVLPSLQGKEVGVKFANDMIADGHVAVIEAETLQPSHLQGQRNPAHFIDEAQPKERNDEASIASARKIASNIRPEEITSSVTAYTGAPTVNTRGEAIQGNSRSDALRVMWAEHPDQAEKYKQYLVDHAEKFGLNAEEVAAMQHPVLVNMIDVSDTDAINLGQYVAQDTESGGTERIKAKNVARKMGGDIRSYANILLRSSEEDASFSELVDKNGVEAMKWMNTKGYITPTQYASAFDAKGNMTAEAKNDLRGILYQSIFQGGNTQLEEQFNAMPAKAQKAILATAYRDYDSPNSERMIAEIQGSIRAYYALSHDRAFVDAKNYKEAKEAMLVWSRQYQMDDVTGESFLPSENFSNFALELAVVYKGWTQTNIQSHFNNVYDIVQGTKEASLFEEADNTPRTLAEAIKETFNIEYNGQLNSNSLAVNREDGQAGERGSDGDTASGERTESREGSADSGRGADAAREQGEVDAERDYLEHLSSVIYEIESELGALTADNAEKYVKSLFDNFKWETLEEAAEAFEQIAKQQNVSPLSVLPYLDAAQKEARKLSHGLKTDRKSLPNGDVVITNYDSNGKLSAVTVERDGEVVSVGTYEDGALFERTDYDANGNATKVTRYKDGEVVSEQEYKDGKRKVTANVFEMAEEAQKKRKAKEKSTLNTKYYGQGDSSILEGRNQEGGTEQYGSLNTSDRGEQGTVLESTDSSGRRGGRGSESEARGSEGMVAASSDNRRVAVDNIPLRNLKNHIRRLQGAIYAIDNTEKVQGINEDLSTKREDYKKELSYAKEVLAKKEGNKWGVEDMQPVSLETAEAMFNEWNDDADVKALFDRVFDVFKKFGIDIKFDDAYKHDNKKAFFDAAGNHIVLPMHMTYEEYVPQQEKATILLHEMIHGVTQYVLHAVEMTPESRREKGINISKGMLEAADQLHGIYNYISVGGVYKDVNGMQSVHEMVSQLADPNFRAFLKEQRLWDKIVEAIQKLLGIPVENNALDTSAKLLDYILDNYDIEAYNKLAGRMNRAYYSQSSDDNLRFRDGDNAELKEKYTDEQIFDAAKQKFGVTDDIREAGYILPDGSMLDFSGRYAVDGDASHLKGGRHMDHREVNQIAYDANDNETGLETNMTDFIERGAIRIHYSNSGVGVINLNIAPTKEQKARLRQLISAHNGNMDVDFGNGWNTEHHAEYDNAKPTRILGDIDRYYSEGVRPEGNILYRDGAPFFSNAERAVENIKQQKATPEQWLAMIKKDGGLKAGEDKWMGLSDWLNEQKAEGVKTLTKDEVLAYIRENQIEIEEVEYGDNPVGFDELKEEYEAMLRDEGYDAAHDAMVDRYGDDFDIAFEDLGGELAIVNEEAAAALLGSENIINPTRLEYTTEGLENKKEIAFVVPTIESWNQSDNIHFGDAGEGRAVAWVRFGETTTPREEKYVREVKLGEPFKNFAGDDVYPSTESKKDYIVHKTLRDGTKKFVPQVNERPIGNTMETAAFDTLEEAKEAMSAYYKEHPLTKVVNERVLVIDEVQSKRHDEGRAKGYKPRKEDVIKATEAFQTFNREMREKYGDVPPWDTWSEEEQAELTRLTREHHRAARSYDRGIPDAPFDKNYHELVMKRMLRYAAENGFDKVAWTKGVQQAERYGLSEKVDSISVEGSGRWVDVNIATKSGVTSLGVDKESGKVSSTFEGDESYFGVPLSDVLGKELADKVLNLKDGETISGEGLSIGGEDRGALYDKMIPSFMRKYVKKWGTKVGEVTLPNVEEAGRTMWSVDVTPEMRESVMQGQPMFREGMGAISDREVSYENDPIAKWQGKPRYYGKRAAAFAERERRRMAQAAEATAKTLSLEVEVVTDAATASQLTQQRMKRRPKAKGWYDVGTGKIVVVVPNHVSAGDAVRTVLHEGVAHHGLRELFGDGFDAMLDNIYNNVAPELKARIDAIAERTGVDTRVATEEYLAGLAEDTNFEYAKRTGWWAKIWNYFVKMLNKLGMPGLNLKEELTDNELRYLLWRSYQNLVDPNSYLKPLGYLDDVAKQKELKVGEYAWNTMATPRAADIDAIEDAEAEEWALVTMQRIDELEAQAAQLEDEIAVMEADRDADDESRYDIWEQQMDPLRKQLEDVYAELEGLYSLEAEAEEMDTQSYEEEKQRKLYQQRIDNAYLKAVREGDWEEATDLFRQYVLSKAEDEGIVPMDYGVGYRGGAHSSIAKKVKEENPDAIAEAAYQMSIRIPKGSILVPMPSRTGNATYTVKLAEAIAKATDSEVRDVLKGKARMSVYEAKQKGVKMTPEDLGMYTTEELPKGKNIVIIDNVIDKGTTALAAVSAVKGASVVAYAYTLGDKQRVASLKLAEPVTYDDNKRIIPLSRRFDKETDDIRYRLVDDPAEIERLENEPTIKAYRAMQVINGELYPPMSAVVDGKLREPIALGQWEQSEERPDLADDNGRFKLDKGNKKSLKAAYNPYFHSSSTPLNDQFSEAQDRDNLVTVEVEIPQSEADGTSGYKAEKAKDAVGTHQWKAGIIQGQLTGTREVFLTRWDKPVRIVPESEVADVIVEMFDGKDIVMPSNVVTPQLRKELEARGITFVETDNQGKLVEGEHKGEHYSKVYGKKAYGGLRYRTDADEQFNKELDDFKEKRHKGLMHLGETGSILRAAGVDAKEITMSPTVLHQHLKKHGLTADDLKGLAGAIQSPILVYKHGEKHPNLVIATEIDVNGGKLSISLKLDKDGKVVEVSNVSSVHSKEASKEIERLSMLDPKTLKEYLRWVEKEKVSDWLGLPYEEERQDANPKLVSIAKVINEFVNPKVDDENLRNSEEIIAEVERESANLGVQVRIARSIDELPDEDTRKRAEDGKLKGYFDTRTGEVVVYEPNTNDANDAKRTILHEIVGHKGLRQLIGEERYDKTMAQLMYMLPSEVRDAVLRRAERHGWNAAIAMDEYLADQAERDVQPTWWGKVNAKIRAILRNLGFDVKLTDADVTYLLWRSRKKLMGDTAFDMVTDAILKQAARKSVDYDAESDNAIRYRGVEQGKKISEAVSDYYEKYTATTNADKFWGGVKYMATHLGDGGTRALLNDLSESQFEDIRSVRVLEEAIESAEGKPLRENEMVHKSLNAKTSRDARDMDKSQAGYFQPMAKLLGKILGKKIDGRKIEIDDVERYLICKHSPENNEFLMKRAHAENRRKKIHERAKELMKGTMTEEEAIAQATSEYTLHQSDFRDDYSGLTELFPDEMVREAKITERTEELTSNGVDEVTARQMASREFESYEPTLEDREKMAADEVARFEAAVDGLHEELWGIINGINRDTIERLFRSGLISRSLYNDLKKRHKFYVPLSGWKNDAAADIYNYAMYGFDGTPIQTVIKKAFGTKYQARNILGSMFAMNMAAITEGNQNLVKQKLYNLALNHDTGVLQIVDLWEVKDGEGDAAEWKPAPKPELRPTMSDAEMQKALTDYQNKLMEMEKDGKARKAVNSLADNFGKHTTDKEAKRHHVELLVNGRKVVIWVNGNPKLAQAINGDLKVKKELLFFDGAVDNANRFLAQVQTSLNPEFMISNFERDILSASRYNLIKYGPKYEASFMKHLAQLMPIVSETNADMRSDVWGGAGIFNLFALDRNTNNPNRKPDAQVLDMNNPLHREFVNFLNYGGKTGYVERKQAEDLQQRIKKLSKREQSIIRKFPAEVAGWAVDTIEHLNEGIENATRFAAYLTARERGKSVTEAVFEAKEVSVNFNMQGSGAWGNASYRKLYNYFNVGLQSLRREKNLGREFPKAYIANLAFMMALGAISTVLLTADWDGDDEDEYMGLSDFNRYNYINVKTENGFIHYSLPQDLRAFYAIGCISTEWAMGKIDGSRAMQAYATQANNYTPLSFVSTTIDREPDSNPVKNLAMSFVPSAAVPVAEIAVNEDFLGRRIHNQNQWNEYEPEWQRAGYRTPEWVINASKTLSEVGGGTEHKRGVWFTEINPSNAWHIMDSYGGGFLDFAQKTYNLVEREFAGKEHELRDYPMVSKFYVESGQDYSKQRVVNDRYRMYREDYETIDNELNGYLKDKSNALGKLSVRAKEEGLPESVVNKERAEIKKTYEDNVKRVKESPNYWIYESFVPYEKRYNRLNSNLGEARKYGSEQTEKELSGEMYNVRKKLVDEIDAKRERPIDRVRQWLGN